MQGQTPLRYYSTVLYRRLRHYAERRTVGYTDRGSLPTAAHEILRANARGGFRAGSHFPGVWVRDLCFAARGLTTIGLGEFLRAAAEMLLEAIDTTFYTEVYPDSAVATPAEGVDTFPALTIVLDEVGALEEHESEIARLATLHRRTFFDDDRHVVSGAGSSWWDSAAHPREAYNTAVLLAAVRRLERRAVETTYTGCSGRIHDGLIARLWNGRYFDERPGSSTLACDANVVPLYFGLVTDDRAARIVGALADLETPRGLRMRTRPFTPAEVRPAFLLHRDYHYHVWPWNSFMYANGLIRYGYGGRARREVERIERRLDRVGNFLEVLSLDGGPYVKRGYASAEDFTVAAALWVEYRNRLESTRSRRRYG